MTLSDIPRFLATIAFIAAAFALAHRIENSDWWLLRVRPRLVQAGDRSARYVTGHLRRWLNL